MLSTINENRQVEIPAEVLQAAGVKIGERVEVDHSNGNIVIRRTNAESPVERLHRAQIKVQKFIKPGVSLADELIAERRAEAAREAAE